MRLISPLTTLIQTSWYKQVWRKQQTSIWLAPGWLKTFGQLRCRVGGGIGAWFFPLVLDWCKGGSGLFFVLRLACARNVFSALESPCFGARHKEIRCWSPINYVCKLGVENPQFGAPGNLWKFLAISIRPNTVNRNSHCSYPAGFLQDICFFRAS